jgi:hypothetical protein
MNYSELVAAVEAYTQNYESVFVANIPVFTKQAEKRIYNSVQFPALKKNVSGTTTANNKYLACPNDFLASFSLAVIAPVTGEYTYLLNKDVNFMRQAYPSPTDTGSPRYYSIFGPQSTNADELTFILAPTPDATYTMELHYYFYPESIVTAGTSWLGDNFDPVLLYATLVEAYTFMKGEQDLIQLYDGKFKEAMQMAIKLGDGLERRDSYRNGQFRIEL